VLESGWDCSELDFDLLIDPFRVTCGDFEAGEDGPDFDARFVEVFLLRGNLGELEFLLPPSESSEDDTSELRRFRHFTWRSGTDEEA